LAELANYINKAISYLRLSKSKALYYLLL